LVAREFWINFFKGPLQLSFEREGTSLERMMTYAIIHHDHHFLCKWADSSFETSLKFDNIREIIETNFPKEREWVRLFKRTNNEVNALLRIIFFIGFHGVHDNVFKLLSRDSKRI